MSGLRENWAGDCSGRRGGACACRRCLSGGSGIDGLARRSLSAALAHAQQGRFETDMGAEAETRRKSLILPGEFLGWGRPVPIMQVLAPKPPEDFVGTNRRFLYRIAKRGESSPLYIGMAFSSRVRDRVASHVGEVISTPATLRLRRSPIPGRSEVANLRQEIKRELQSDRTLKNITVQLGTIKAGTVPLDAKLLHAYEATLQVLDRPKTYVGSAWTFEEEGQ
jgi:hypothetical protein